jgi:hypothetical protein
MINKKFLKYQKIINEKEEEINKLIHNNKYEEIYNLNRDNNKNNNNFFIDWMIVDSTTAKNGPSDWNINKDEGNMLEENSFITSFDSVSPATSIILNKEITENNYYKLIFITKSDGIISFKFKFVDFYNYLALEFNRNSNYGEIKIIQKINGIVTELYKLPCQRMVTILRKCEGYSINENNIVEIIEHNKNYIILFNKKQVHEFNIEIEEFKLAKMSISINNQTGFKIKTLEIKKLTSKDIDEIKPLIHNNNNDLNNKELSINSDNIEENVDNTKKSKRYNPITNKFEYLAEKKYKYNSENKSNKILEKKPIIIKNQETSTDICGKYSSEKFICNYLNTLIKQNNIDLKTTKLKQIMEIARFDCVDKMKNLQICKSFLVKLEPIILSIQNELSLSKLLTKNNIKKPKKDIKQLIKSCNFDFLPKLLQNRTICMNEIMRKELDTRRYDKSDQCVKEFCGNCCYINYGNRDCNICNS